MEFGIAVGSMLVSIVCAVGVFFAAKKALRMPALLNVPGALLAFLTAIGLTGWINVASGVFDNQIGPPAPDIPWYTWMIYAAITMVWYVMMWLLVRLWRRGRANPKEGIECRT
ncbi:MAG: hypothetical protein KAX55_00285 [Propionivibrio sp.]|nr:hypothetical protein [Propionivibrio sp.]